MNIVAHIHECNRKDGFIFFETTHHGFLALDCEDKALSAYRRNRGDGTFDFFFRHKFEFQI